MKPLIRKEIVLITNDVNDYMNLLVRITHIICNHSLLAAQTCRTPWNDGP